MESIRSACMSPTRTICRRKRGAHCRREAGGWSTRTPCRIRWRSASTARRKGSKPRASRRPRGGNDGYGRGQACLSHLIKLVVDVALDVNPGGDHAIMDSDFGADLQFAVDFGGCVKGDFPFFIAFLDDNLFGVQFQDRTGDLVVGSLGECLDGAAEQQR